MSVRSVVQQALSASLASDNVFIYWMRKAAVPGENPDEYVVYTVDSDGPTLRADSEVLIKDANPVVRYYHGFGMAEADVSAREQQIETALKAAGLFVTSGPFDAGDIDEVGMNTTVFECSFTRLIDG